MKNAGDFITFASTIITAREKEKVRKLINFKFKRHPTYNLSAPRLRNIEEFIQGRVMVLLNL